MVIINATLQAQKGKEKELESIFRELVSETAKETGSIEYRLHNFEDDPGKFRFYEKFKDQEAFDAHANSSHFKTLIDKAAPLLAGEPVLEKLKLIDSIPE